MAKTIEQLEQRLAKLEQIVKRITKPHICYYDIVQKIQVTGGGEIQVKCCSICHRVK